MSPEVLAHGIEEYLKALQDQANTAEAIYFGRLEEGMEGLLALPEDVRLKIDQLVWEASGGESLDPTEEKSERIIAAAIIHSLESRMGLHPL